MALVNVETLDIGELGVVDCHLVAKEGAQSFCHLGGEGYLGEEVEYLLSLAHIPIYQVYVYLCLTRGGYTVEEHCLLLAEAGIYLVEGFLLVGRERIEGTKRVWVDVGRHCPAPLAVFLLESLFVLWLHGSWQGALHDVAEGTDVVMGYPLPEGELLLVDDGCLVEEFDDGLHLYSLWLLVVHSEDHTCVYLVFA